MKLYCSPGACSPSPRTVPHEAALPFAALPAAARTHETADGAHSGTRVCGAARPALQAALQAAGLQQQG